MRNSQHEVVGYLAFKKIKIINANTISSPITYGFPAITGFLGAFHAMSRKIQQIDGLQDYQLDGVLLACHECNPQIYRSNRYNNYTFNQTRNPIKRDGKTASIIEEGKCHLTMTFMVEIIGEKDLSEKNKQQLIDVSSQWIQQQRIAGGDVLPISTPQESVHFIEAESINSSASVQLLTPAFILIDASDVLASITTKMQQQDNKATALDALIDTCTLHHLPKEQTNGQIAWQTQSAKTGHGWLTPIPIGYQGISELYPPNIMENIRHPDYPSQYVETIYSLGKWVYPQRLTKNIEQAFWHYHHDKDKHLYLASQSPSN